MTWLEKIKRSPITKIVLVILTAILGSIGGAQTFAVGAGNVPASPQNVGLPIGIILATIGVAYAAWKAGPIGPASIQKIIAQGFRVIRYIGSGDETKPILDGNSRLIAGVTLGNSCIEFSGSNAKAADLARQWTQSIVDEQLSPAPVTDPAAK